MALQPSNCQGPKPIAGDRKVIYEDVYQRKPVPVLHEIEVVERIHLVPVPIHHYVVKRRVEYCGYDC
ncbi:hypothetical protein [Paenibacillus sp. J22TS3]|uniref:hypothetical protein n=1 Tax=Paenibacillus sp. J22TS3 TaxID=2807192 RepID=UPI001B2927E8|nr:hypothetical protein [Paenibacillus sp. J22TS3]GIP21667.1 hypothetical protein J22TS3_19420 [Paenibacillus sp. J22TS3]